MNKTSSLLCASISFIALFFKSSVAIGAQGGWSEYSSMGTTEYSVSSQDGYSIRISKAEDGDGNFSCTVSVDRADKYIINASIVLIVGNNTYYMNIKNGQFTPELRVELNQLFGFVYDLINKKPKHFTLKLSAFSKKIIMPAQNAKILLGSLDGCQ